MIDGLREAFEKNMNDDLSVGRGVDALYRKLRELQECCFPLDPGAARRLSTELERIDTVLRVLTQPVS